MLSAVQGGVIELLTYDGHGHGLARPLMQHMLGPRERSALVPLHLEDPFLAEQTLFADSVQLRGP